MNAHFSSRKRLCRNVFSGRVSRAARGFFGGFLLACATLWGWGAAEAATLDVDLDIRTRAEAGSTVRAQRDVVILVLDRSTSMTRSADAVGRPNETREAVMREMLRDRLEMLAGTRPDAEVWMILFGTAISAPQGPFSPKDSNRILSQLPPPDGWTLLYDAMERAVLFGEDRMKNDPAVRVWMYFYSDGENWPDPNRSYWVETKLESVTGFFGGERTVEKQYRVPVHYEKGDAGKERFRKDYAERIRAYADVGRMSLETGCWLGEGEPPLMIENKRKDEYPLELAVDGTSLKNPATAPSQGLKARVLVPMPARYEKDLERLEAAMVFEGAGKRSVVRFPLAPGKKTLRLALPDGLPATAFSGRLRVSALPDAWKSVALAEPDPVELSFAEPGALSLSGMSPRGERWVATGVPVEFSATATDGAEVTWTIDGAEAGKGTFSKAFDRAGTHRAVATAQKAGFRSASAECTVHAVDTAVAVVVAPEGPRVGGKVSFEARAAGGKKVSWWVDGQAADGKGAKLEDWTFDSSGHHTAKARVHFDHGLYGDGEAYFKVEEAPHVSISDPWPGKEFAPGEEITAVAKVEGGFDRVVWTLRGPEDATNEAEVDRNVRQSHPAAFKPGTGGEYELTAEAVGAAGRLEAKPVRFKVAREDAWVRIEEPKGGAVVPTGRNLDLRAVAQGEEAKKILWKVKDVRGNDLFSATRPAEGGVSQCSFAVPETLGNGTTLFVSAEAVGDPELRSETDVETRCANCAEMGALLSLSHAGDERRNFGRGEKIVAELKDLRGDVRDIEWTFGEDGRGAGRVVEWNGWTEYNVYPVKATGRCGKCGAARDFGQESVIVERRPLKASFAITERGSYYTAGGKLHLTSTSEGDIDSFIWTVDGEELTDFHDKQEATVDLPFMACNPVLVLTVRSAEGDEESSYPQDIRVRFGKWVTLPAAILLLAAICISVRLFTGNRPKGWTFYTWEGAAPVQIGGGYPEELGSTYLVKGVERDGVSFWNYWTKKGRLLLGDMLMLGNGVESAWLPLADAEFEVQALNDTPSVRALNGDFVDVTGEVNILGELPYFLFKYVGLDYADTIVNGHEYIRVVVQGKCGTGALGAIATVVVVGACMGTFVWFCLKYAF